MDGVGISIIERPRPLHNHDTPNPTQHPYTLKCEEPVNVRIEGLTRMFKGLGATNTARRTPLCPKRRRPRPQQPVCSVICRGGLHFGRNNAPDRDLIVTNRGELHDTRVRHAGDTPQEGFV